MNQDQQSTRPRRLALLLLLAPVVFLSAELSRQLSADISHMSAVWPPLGIAVGSALVLGSVVVPLYGVVIAAWFLYAGYQPALAVALAGLETAMAAALLLLLRGARGDGPLISSLRDTLKFYLYASLVVLLPSSALVTWVVRELGYFRDFFFGDVMLVYWLAEALGVMLFAPLTQQVVAHLISGRQILRVTRDALVYTAVLAGLLVLNYWLMVSGQYLYGKVLTYFYFPLMAYAAISNKRWLAPASVALVGVVVPALVVMASSTLEAPGFALLEAVIVIFLMTLMTQLVQAVSKERHGLLRRFEDQAQRDLLTGLGNDRALLNSVQTSRAGNTLTHERLAVVELCNFEDTHDLLEQSFSVRLEQYVAAEIRQLLTPQAVVARLGPGQFGFHWRGDDEAAFEHCIRAIVERLNGQVYVEPGAVYRMYIAIGCIEMQPVDDPAAVLPAARRVAGLAAGARDYPVCQSSMDDPRVRGRQERLQMLEELKEALSQDRLVLFAQQIQKAEGPASDRLSFEILVRMRGRDGQILMPGEFLPVAEDYGIMGDVDRWVVKAVYDWALRSPEVIGRVRKCAINLSGMTLSDPGFLTWLQGIRKGSPLAPECICFEVTETQMIGDWAQASALLTALRAEGYRISLDDFGTGLATFEYLTRFPFDYVKIDGRFVRNVLASPVDQSIIRSITDVAATMGLETIAEFVTGNDVRERVAVLGVDYVQGYAVALPMPLSELMLRHDQPDGVSVTG